jgi:phage/conjugal plasmid C-4 type zinc finger TraR family protein
MDMVDLAHEYEEQQRVLALRAIGKPPGTEPSRWDCEDCLEAIPAARRVAVPGCTRCVECQERVERQI